MRIPMPNQINPNALSGDRLAFSNADLGAPARALQGLGRAVSGLAQEWQANQDKMDGYNANLAMERWSTDSEIAYQNNLDGSAADGADFPQKQEDYLLKAYQNTLKTIKNPEDQARFTMLFERTRGNQVVRAMKDSERKGESYVKATTGESINTAVKSGAITSEAQYQDYRDNVVVPRIKQYIKDPLEQQATLAIFDKQMRQEYIRLNPQIAMPRQMGGDDSYYSRLRQIESGGNDNARNPSGAAGRYQFMPATAAQYGISNPYDVNQQETAIRKLTADNRAFLKKMLGREPSPGELYLAHQQGAGGAARLLANPNDTAVNVVGRQAVIQNGGNENMSAGEFANLWVSKFEGTKMPAGADFIAPPMPSGGMWDSMDSAEWDGYTMFALNEDKERVKAEEEQAKAAKDDLLKSGYDLMFGNQLSADWIEQNRETLTPTEYRTFNNALKRQQDDMEQAKVRTQTDNSAYINLLNRASADEDQQAVQDDLFSQFADGKIRKTDFNKLLGLSRTTEKNRGAKPWLSDIRSTLSARLRPTDEEDTAQYSKRLDAVFALDDWVEANPNATRDEVKKKANELADEFAGAATADLRQGLEMPRYVTTGRYTFNTEALPVVGQRLMEAYKSGKITQEQFNREARLLKQWKSVFDEEARQNGK